MSTSSASVLTRLKARNPLPQGTLVVGAGLVVNGVMLLAFAGVAARALGGPAAYAPLSYGHLD